MDETEVGEGTSTVLIDAKRPAEWKETTNPAHCAEWLGLEPLHSFLDWDLFEAVQTPGALILMITFKDHSASDEFMGSVILPDGARMRSVRVIRDLTMFDRREAPQYYPDVQRPDRESHT